MERGFEEAQHSDGTTASVVFALMKTYACMQRNYNFMEDAFRAFHYNKVQVQEEHEATIVRLTRELA